MGKKGTGKTTLVKNLIYKLYGEQVERVLVYDSMLEYDFQPLKSFKNFSGIKRITPNIFNADDNTVFEKVTQLVYEMGNLLYVVDEVDLFCSANYTPLSLQKIFRYGRHFKIDMIIVTRRPAAIPRHLTAMIDEFYLFKSHEARDLKYYEDLQTNLGQRVKNLHQFEHLLFSP